ncbi:hypothetical protein TSH58_00185 [Azospirillum sp. TSH58]|nr:hypothetical protein TSH58_00185 [Azospirillum sp. TSH58]
MTMFNAPGIRHILITIVNHRITQDIFRFEPVMLETKSAIFKNPKIIAEKLIQGTRIYDMLRLSRQFGAVTQKIDRRVNLDTIQQPLNQLGISALRNSLISIVEVIVIICKPERQPFDDPGRKFSRIFLPLLHRIATDQKVVDSFTNHRQRLLFQVFRLTV